MTVATWLQTNFATQLASTWKAAIDGDFQVATRIADAFAVRERASPNMKVDVDAGWVFQGTSLTEVASQTSATIVAPVTNPRIDYIVADRISGTVAVITGTEAASPVAPPISSAKVPLATIALATSTTSITNSLITDKRAVTAFGRGLAGELNIGVGLRNDGANNLQVSLPSATPSTNQTLSASNHLTQYKNTAPITYNLPRANTLWVGYEVDIYAQGGAATLSPNAADIIAGGSAGTAFTVPITGDVKLYLSGAGSTGQWDVRGQTDSGVTAGSYTIASVTVDRAGRVTAASSGSSSSGNFNKISSGSLTGLSLIAFTSLNGRYKLILDGLIFSTGTTNAAILTFSTNNGSSYLATNYAYSFANDGGGSYNHAGSTTGINIPLTPSIMATVNPSSIEIDIFNAGVTPPTTNVKYSAIATNSSGVPSWVMGAGFNAVNANAIKAGFTNALSFGSYTLYQLT